jgi:hypothetical protein
MAVSFIGGENLRPITSHWQILSHNVVHLALIEIRTHNISWVFEFCNKLFAESYWTMNLLNFIFELSNETTYLLSSEIMRLDYNCLLIFIWCHDAVSLAWIFFRVSFIGGENLRPITSHWQILSHNVVHLALIEIRTHNISGDRHLLHR